MFEEFYNQAPRDLGQWLSTLKLSQTIDGKDADAEMTSVVHPANGLSITHYPDADIKHADAAVAAAHAAFDKWSNIAWTDRQKLLEDFADALSGNMVTLAFIISAETGRPLRKAHSEAFFAVNYVRTIAAQNLSDIDYDRPGLRVQMVHRPLGVAVAIAPWNGPVILAVAKIANALLAGDTLVLRPAPQTPLSALYMGMMARDIFPPGVINVITGDASVSSALVEHTNVAKISFTGSTETGRRIAMLAAPRLKRLTLELGGNDAAIVLEDADVDSVAETVYRISLENAGQFCAAIKRLYVHSSVYDRLRDAIVSLASTAVAGPALDPKSTLAPLQSAMQRSRVQEFVDDALSRNARATGPDIDIGETGFFLPPILLEDCGPDFPVVAEEQFGPALPIIAFDDEQIALRQANRNDYGLGGSVWSADGDRARALAANMQCGTAWINHHGAFSAALPMPFVKQSGLGMDYAHYGVAEHSGVMVLNQKLA